MKRLFTGTLLTLNCFCFFSATAQFQKVYGNDLYDQEAQDVVATADGGYLLAGYSTNNTANDRDVYIIRVDGSGNVVWSKTIGGAKVDFTNRILPTGDGNYLLVGHSQSFGGGDYDIFVIKISDSGNEVWKKTFGSNGNELGMDVVATSDGKYAIIASSKDAGSSDYNINLRKIDGDGNELWSKTYGGTAHDYGSSVKLCSDGGFVLFGQTYSSGAGSGDAFLVRTDASGIEQWAKTYGGTFNDEGIYLTVNGDGSFTFVVRDSSTAGKDIDVKVFKTDASGVEIWTKQFGGTDKDTPKMIQPTADGGYIIAAISRSFGWVNPDMWLLKLNSSGDSTWSRHFGGFNNEHCYTARESSDGILYAAGKTQSYGPGLKAIFLKLNAQGLVGLNELSSSTASIQAFPNPTTGRASLTFHKGTQTLEVRNCMGDLLINKNVKGLDSLDLDISPLSSGIYTLITKEDGKITSVFKIILDH